MKPMWTPTDSAVTHSQMTAFMKHINQQHQTNLSSYSELHAWSIQNLEACWESIWNFCNIIASNPATQILKNADDMENAIWFEDATLNFAENLLQRRDNHTAIIAVTEKNHYRELSYAELFHQVAVLADHLKKLGINAGDRVAAFMPNSPETLIAMLATTSLGAVWSSCSSDFGIQGLLDRFTQIEPKVLFAAGNHQYNGRQHQHIETIETLQSALPSIEETILISSEKNTAKIESLSNTILWSDLQSNETPELVFEQLPFNHPLYILYSSGTTGKPKCMVHGAGGTLLQHAKELRLHTNLQPEDKIFFYTTCGWMMWNWLVSSLTVGATIVLYDGSPFFPKPKRLFDLIDKVGITVFGVGAKLVESFEKAHLTPKTKHSLKTLRTILTTASPLLPESFDYVYEKIKSDVCLSSISGGSDIISCFALGNPNLPVYRGELQCPGIGMDMKVFNESGEAVSQEKGELVCTSPFPSQPIFFWNDPNNEKYHHAYFAKYKNTWAHGDYAEITKNNGFIIYGRSDTTLNPGGIRIGTAEIYQQIEKIDEIIDCLAVGQNWRGSERIILFVVMREGEELDRNIEKMIKALLKKNASPHHVPAKIVAVPDLPRTLSGKLVEIAVKKTIHNEEVKNTDALANPESLKHFKNLKVLEEA